MEYTKTFTKSEIFIGDIFIWLTKIIYFVSFASAICGGLARFAVTTLRFASAASLQKLHLQEKLVISFVNYASAKWWTSKIRRRNVEIRKCSKFCKSKIFNFLKHGIH